MAMIGIGMLYNLRVYTVESCESFKLAIGTLQPKQK